MADEHDMRGRLAEVTAGDYEILSELGRGGMATVFLARDLSLDRQVAIKVMAPQLLAVEGMAERFLLEARIAAALSHPHIIPIHAVRRAGGVLYFVMQYVAGRSLDAVLREAGPLPVPVVRAVLTQVGAALEAAHRRGVVHRDIKPANILIDAQGDAVVADFGIARLGEAPGMTQAGQTVGTPAYMSPEQCAGEPLTGAADQYALGVVAYELLTGAPPFAGENLMQVVWRMVHEELVPLATVRPECAGPVADTVHRMLARRAEDRWPGVAAAVAALPPLVLAHDDPHRRVLQGAGPAAAAATGGSSVATRVLPATGERPVTSRVSSITLQATSGTMTIDDRVQLATQLRAEDDATVDGDPVLWESADPAVARVSEDGVLTAVGIGATSIVARAGDALTTLSVLVTRARVRGLAIAPRPATLGVGDRLQLAATSSEQGVAQAKPRLVGWSSSDPARAQVDPNGRVTALAEGAVEITARTGGAVATLPLRVTPAVIASVSVSPREQRLTVGERLRLDAAPANPKGHPLPGFAVRWEVSDAGIAAISPDGVLTALRSGQVLVAARVGGRVGTARVTVALPPIAARAR